MASSGELVFTKRAVPDIRRRLGSGFSGSLHQSGLHSVFAHRSSVGRNPDATYCAIRAPRSSSVITRCVMLSPSDRKLSNSGGGAPTALQRSFEHGRPTEFGRQGNDGRSSPPTSTTHRPCSSLY